MMKSKCFLALHVLTIAGFGIQIGLAQGPPQASPEHTVLAEDVGTWDVAMKIWTGPGSPALEGKGTEINTMFGPFFVLSEFKVDIQDQPFEGRGTFGYDPSKKKYVGTWLDTMSPFISHMEGTYDASTKTMTMISEGTGPDGKPSRSKMVSVIHSDGTKTFTMYMIEPGTDNMTKSMEIKYTKK